MERKNNLIKNIFYIFFAFCFLCTGFSIFKTNQENHVAFAEDTSTTDIDNSQVPEYFLSEEFVQRGESSTKENNSLISQNTFLYYDQAASKNFLKLSFATNGSGADDNSIYSYVYYPNPSDTSVFYFYDITHVNVSYNGKDIFDNQQQTTKQFIKPQQAFPQFSSVNLDSFEMIFNDTGNSDNDLSILNEDGHVNEGLYSVSIELNLVVCNDGKLDMTEDPSSFKDHRVEFTYSFYCFARESYFQNNQPKISNEAFDHVVEIGNTTSEYGFNLFSNFSSKGSSNKIPFVEYDIEHYDLKIEKRTETETFTRLLQFDKETQTIVENGANIVKTQIIDKTCRVYFTDVGEYSITLNAIAVLPYGNLAPYEMRKYNLVGVTSHTKKVMVYMFGYQANFTDFDSEPDENHIRPKGELKDFKFLDSEKNPIKGEFVDSADITSIFLNSNSNYAQNSAANAQIGNRTFVPNNIVNFINRQSIKPIQTNQTPVELTTNATLQKNASYILTTNQITSNYEDSGLKLGEKQETLYRTQFEGRTEGSAGKYIYLLAYTFNNFRDTEISAAPNRVFYQVFFFEVVKDLPSIEVFTGSDNESKNIVSSGTFVNEAVTLLDSTKAQPYNKDVTVQIYAQDYNNNNVYISRFGGENGIALSTLSDTGNLKLETNAHFTIRLYYTSDLKDNNLSTNIHDEQGFFREQSFTIDTEKVKDVTGHNVVANSGASTFKVVSQMNFFSTNQNMALSWKEKNSGAKTFAYYRKFPIVNTNYYVNDKAALHKLIEEMVIVNKSLPVDNVLDLNATSSWLPYGGNIEDQVTIGTQFVLSDQGLYLIDVFDEAGNHTYEVFMIDYTTPVFAMYENGAYDLISASKYITSPATLYWGNNKNIYVANFNSSLYTNPIYTPETIQEEDLKVFDTSDGEKTEIKTGFYYTRSGEVSTEIYKLIYNTLFKQSFLKNIALSNSISSANPLIENYSGMYVSIPIHDISYYIDKEHPIYTQQNSVNHWQAFTAEKEMTFRLLVRDMSNTKLDSGYADSPFAAVHYQNYYSARQTVSVSFDPSQFNIQYTASDGTLENLTSNTTEESELTVDNTKREVLTTYLSPTKMSELLSLSFVPTISNSEINIQIDTVTMQHYAYERKVAIIDSLTGEDKNPTGELANLKLAESTDIIRYYYGLSETASTNTVYSFEDNQQQPMTDTFTRPIQPNAENQTTEGKYVITRTYRVTDNFDYNPKDYYQRTYVLIVDRNEVVSNPVQVGEGQTSHYESLVGGDIFVAMYDNGLNSSFVVTFPNSENGNSDSSTIHNNATPDEENIILTTNKLPVHVYVPMFKYTKYVSKVEHGNGAYHFEVTNSENLNNYKTSENDDNETDNLPISEYALTAEIEKLERDKNGKIISSEIIGRSSSDLVSISNGKIVINQNTTSNGFLKFYKPNGQELNTITEAGQYRVRITQGRFTSESGANSFEKSHYFQFEIKQSTPDFTVRTNRSNLYSEKNDGEIKETYYTNQSDLHLVWEASTNKYMAEIDIEKTKFEFISNGVSRTLTAKDVWGEKNSDSWPQLQSDKTYIASLDLKKLGLYNHNQNIKVTMQFQNQDQAQTLYKPISKRIVVDLSAPSANVEHLVDQSISSDMINFMQRKDLRVYRKATSTETATDLNNTSFNISNRTGDFAYFSYSVNKEYLKILLETDGYFQTYVRAFKNGNTVTKYNQAYSQYQETDPSDFREADFTEINSANFKGFEANTYYEVVEMDKAGNMAIYTIFITDYTLDKNLISYTFLDKQGNVRNGNYTSKDFREVQSYPNAVHNIFSRTGFEIENLDFFGDEWAQIKLETVDARNIKQTRYIMLNPWKKGYATVYSVSGSSQIALKDLIDSTYSSNYKNTLTFFNRENQLNNAIYINIKNSSLSAELTNQQTSEYIRFSAPSDAEIQSKTSATNFLTYLKISVSTNSLPIYEQTHKMGYANLWTSNDNILVSFDQSTQKLKFELNPALSYPPNTRIEYVYRDNYDQEYTEIHLYREAIIQTEFSAENNPLYAYYDENGRLYYITKDAFQYTYNPAKYTIEAFDYDIDNKIKGSALTKAEAVNVTSAGIRTTTFKTLDTAENLQDGIYNDCFVLEIKDVQTGVLVKEVYFTLYNELPTANLSDDKQNAPGEFKFQNANGTNITDKILPGIADEETGYFSEVRILFNNKENTFLPIRYSISQDKLNWRPLISGERLRCQGDQPETYYVKVWYDETYLVNEFGNTRYVFGQVPESQIYQFSLSSLTATYWLEKTVNGVTTIIEKSDTVYVASNGRQYTTHYQVNLSYADKDLVHIRLNKEQNLRAILQTPVFIDNSDVRSELYLITNRDYQDSNIPSFETYIVITYIPNKDDIVEEFYTYNLNGSIDTSDNLINSTTTTKSIVVPEIYTSLDKIELQWTKYYGIVQNEININLIKDGVKLDPVVYSRVTNGKEYFYTYLTYSGKYSISLFDKAGNIQKFNRGTTGQTEKFTLTFLKDVPFTLTYTDVLTGEEKTSLPIKQAVYNSAVTLKIDPATRSEFYSTNGQPKITVKRNGVEFDGKFEDNSTSFTFEQTGYYEVTFSASSNLHDVDAIRQETYQFSIINPQEFMISHVYNRYSNYYVEKVLKDGQDITEALLKTLDVETIVVNKKTYLAQLPLSYLDEKTGSGEYIITVNSNNQLFKSSSVDTSWTYKVNIKSGSAPIKISLAEGAKTTAAITVTFNQENIFDELGECTFRIVRQNDNGTVSVMSDSSVQIDETSTGELTKAISSAEGTFYIQFVSPSNYLLFSYKVIRTAPMNAASIIAIVISAIVAIVVIILIIKLRKRISVK